MDKISLIQQDDDYESNVYVTTKINPLEDPIIQEMFQQRTVELNNAEEERRIRMYNMMRQSKKYKRIQAERANLKWDQLNCEDIISESSNSDKEDNDYIDSDILNMKEKTNTTITTTTTATLMLSTPTNDDQNNSACKNDIYENDLLNNSYKNETNRTINDNEADRMGNSDIHQFNKSYKIFNKNGPYNSDSDSDQPCQFCNMNSINNSKKNHLSLQNHKTEEPKITYTFKIVDVESNKTKYPKIKKNILFKRYHKSECIKIIENVNSNNETINKVESDNDNDTNDNSRKLLKNEFFTVNKIVRITTNKTKNGGGSGIKNKNEDLKETNISESSSDDDCNNNPAHNQFLINTYVKNVRDYVSNHQIIRNKTCFDKNKNCCCSCSEKTGTNNIIEKSILISSKKFQNLPRNDNTNNNGLSNQENKTGIKKTGTSKKLKSHKLIKFSDSVNIIP